MAWLFNRAFRFCIGILISGGFGLGFEFGLGFGLGNRFHHGRIIGLRRTLRLSFGISCRLLIPDRVVLVIQADGLPGAHAQNARIGVKIRMSCVPRKLAGFVGDVLARRVLAALSRLVRKARHIGAKRYGSPVISEGFGGLTSRFFVENNRTGGRIGGFIGGFVRSIVGGFHDRGSRIRFGALTRFLIRLDALCSVAIRRPLSPVAPVGLGTHGRMIARGISFVGNVRTIGSLRLSSSIYAHVRRVVFNNRFLKGTLSQQGRVRVVGLGLRIGIRRRVGSILCLSCRGSAQHGRIVIVSCAIHARIQIGQTPLLSFRLGIITGSQIGFASRFRIRSRMFRYRSDNVADRMLALQGNILVNNWFFIGSGRPRSLRLHSAITHRGRHRNLRRYARCSRIRSRNGHLLRRNGLRTIELALVEHRRARSLRRLAATVRGIAVLAFDWIGRAIVARLGSFQNGRARAVLHQNQAQVLRIRRWVEGGVFRKESVVRVQQGFRVIIRGFGLLQQVREKIAHELDVGLNSRQRHVDECDAFLPRIVEHVFVVEYQVHQRKPGGDAIVNELFDLAHHETQLIAGHAALQERRQRFHARYVERDLRAGRHRRAVAQQRRRTALLQLVV